MSTDVTSNQVLPEDARSKAPPDLQRSCAWLVSAPLSAVKAFHAEGCVDLRSVGATTAFQTRAGDRLVFYSSACDESGRLYQAFSAVAVLAEPLAQIKAVDRGIRYVARARFLAARPVRIHDLLVELEFIIDAKRWSKYVLRPIRPLSEADCRTLCRALRVPGAHLAPPAVAPAEPSSVRPPGALSGGARFEVMESQRIASNSHAG